MAGNPSVTASCAQACLTTGRPAADKALMSPSDGGRAAALPWLVGDIGATNLRFALAEPAGTGFRLSSAERLQVADHAGLEPALRAYLGSIAPLRPRCGVLAVAGPVLSDDIEVTNTGWRWSTEALRQQLGFDRLVCLNDAEAQALALPNLADADLRSVGREHPPAIASAPRVLIAPGSGLGVSALVTVDGRAHAIAGEGGHVTFAPETVPERYLAAFLGERFGEHVSWERALSGPGIAAIYGLIEQRNGVTISNVQSEAVVRWAQSGDALAKSAVEMFLGLLGSYAGDLALIFGARGGVYVGGGIVPAMVDTIALATFRERFESKGRFKNYLRAIPTAIIMHPTPGLIGAAARLASMQGNEE